MYLCFQFNNRVSKLYLSLCYVSKLTIAEFRNLNFLFQLLWHFWSFKVRNSYPIGQFVVSFTLSTVPLKIISKFGKHFSVQLHHNDIMIEKMRCFRISFGRHSFFVPRSKNGLVMALQSRLKSEIQIFKKGGSANSVENFKW